MSWWGGGGVGESHISLSVRISLSVLPRRSCFPLSVCKNFFPGILACMIFLSPSPWSVPNDGFIANVQVYMQSYTQADLVTS